MAAGRSWRAIWGQAAIGYGHGWVEAGSWARRRGVQGRYHAGDVRHGQRRDHGSEGRFRGRVGRLMAAGSRLSTLSSPGRDTILLKMQLFERAVHDTLEGAPHTGGFSIAQWLITNNIPF